MRNRERQKERMKKNIVRRKLAELQVMLNDASLTFSPEEMYIIKSAEVALHFRVNHLSPRVYDDISRLHREKKQQSELMQEPLHSVLAWYNNFSSN